jgi:hypothetical protein
MKLCRRYRYIQILEILVNEFGQSKFVPVSIVLIPMMEILGLFGTVKLYDVVPLPGFIIYPYAYFCAMVVLLLYVATSGKLFDTSKNILNLWRTLKATKLRRKIIKSLQPLKIKFGSNFIESSTSLVIQSFCLKTVVDLLLLYK